MTTTSRNDAHPAACRPAVVAAVAAVAVHARVCTHPHPHLLTSAAIVVVVTAAAATVVVAAAAVTAADAGRRRARA